ncbi:MAG TPA: carbohydrate-binding family 9-like protein, partial [Polyangiales bacterium]|nr:carbohydrate-binding family 9-like protein [Polyangiales bacterium]
LTLPSDWTSPSAVFYLGFYKGEQRWKVTRGPADAENRAEAARVPVAVHGAAPLPELKAAKLRAAIALDGKLDEPAWQSAQNSGPLLQTFTGGPAEFRASLRVLYDAQQIYVGFEVDDDFLKSSFTTTDDHLWEQDTIEVMFDPDGDGLNYFELQVSPRGAHFDTRYDSRRRPRPFGHVDWDSKVQASVSLRGTVDDAESDGGYSVELAVPWSAFGVDAPKPGASWRMNFFVMDARQNGQRAAAWSPPRVGDFHTLERFGTVRFTD